MLKWKGPCAGPRSRSGGRAALILAALLFAVAAGAQTAPEAPSVCAEAGAIARGLSDITGMKLLRPVPCGPIAKNQINEFLKQRFKEEAKPSDVRAEELVLKKFGFVPPDFDLLKTTVDLLTEQAAAFYDYRRRKLFIGESTAAAAGEPGEAQEMLLAHELSHALADQHFNLAKYMKKGRESDDGSAARLAVMEGQATWLMSEYMARKAGRSLENSPALAAAMSAMSEGGAGQFPVYENAPLYLRATLVFPYAEGMLFQNALIEHDGQAGFTEPFLRAPVSTQQIYHLEKYFSSVKPASPALPVLRLPHGYKALVDGSLGELDHAILIEQFAGKEAAGQIAPHWRGSAFALRENKKAGRVVLLYAVEWDSQESASRYFTFYKEALAKKWKTLSIAAETADSAAGSGDDGRFELRRDGAIVTSVEGLAPALH
ncbi:MAG: hypothetical protein ABSC23_14040 [Bryobacteraceae bacterium]